MQHNWGSSRDFSCLWKRKLLQQQVSCQAYREWRKNYSAALWPCLVGKIRLGKKVKGKSQLKTSAVSLLLDPAYFWVSLAAEGFSPFTTRSVKILWGSVALCCFIERFEKETTSVFAWVALPSPEMNAYLFFSFIVWFINYLNTLPQVGHVTKLMEKLKAWICFHWNL